MEQEAARVSLVGALEKCDRDLEELRRTIEVLKTTYVLQKKVSRETARDDIKFSSTGEFPYDQILTKPLSSSLWSSYYLLITK